MRPVRKMQKDGFVFVPASRSSSPGTAPASRPAKEADPGSSSETENLSPTPCWEAAFDVQCGLLNSIAFPSSSTSFSPVICSFWSSARWSRMCQPFPQKPIVPCSCGPAMSSSAFQAALPATHRGRTEGHSLGCAVIRAGQALGSSSSDTHECFPFFWLLSTRSHGHFSCGCSFCADRERDDLMSALVSVRSSLAEVQQRETSAYRQVKHAVQMTEEASFEKTKASLMAGNGYSTQPLFPHVCFYDCFNS